MILTRAEIVNGTGFDPATRLVPSTGTATHALTRAEVVSGTGFAPKTVFYTVKP